jgi:hypothetical protein
VNSSLACGVDSALVEVAGSVALVSSTMSVNSIETLVALARCSTRSNAVESDVPIVAGPTLVESTAASIDCAISSDNDGTTLDEVMRAGSIDSDCSSDRSVSPDPSVIIVSVTATVLSVESTTLLNEAVAVLSSVLTVVLSGFVTSDIMLAVMLSSIVVERSRESRVNTTDGNTEPLVNERVLSLTRVGSTVEIVVILCSTVCVLSVVGIALDERIVRTDSSIAAVSVSLFSIAVLIVVASERASTDSNEVVAEMLVGALPTDTDTIDASTVVAVSSESFGSGDNGVSIARSTDSVRCVLSFCIDDVNTPTDWSVEAALLNEPRLVGIEFCISPLSSDID